VGFVALDVADLGMMSVQDVVSCMSFVVQDVVDFEKVPVLDGADFANLVVLDAVGLVVAYFDWSDSAKVVAVVD
jgi:hypothetical protein